MIENITRIDFLSSDIEVVEAVAFSKIRNASGRKFLSKQPDVQLRLKEIDLNILDKNVMWQFLDSMSHEKFPYNNYLQCIEVVPLLEIIKDFLFDYPNHMFYAWVEDGTIVGFDHSNNSPHATHQVMEEISHYIKSKNEKYDLSISLRTYHAGQGRKAFKGLTALYISGNKILEIFSRGTGKKQGVIISARYSVGLDFIQPTKAYTFLGHLATLEAKELYRVIDLFLDSLDLMDEKELPQMESISQAHKLTIEDRNRLEFESGLSEGSGHLTYPFF